MRTKQAIMQLLRINEMQYSETVEDLGYMFIRHYCTSPVGVEDYLAKTTAFWKWWCRQFDIADEVFLADYGTYTQPELTQDLRIYWLQAHLPEVVEGRIPDPAWEQMFKIIHQENATAYATI